MIKINDTSFDLGETNRFLEQKIKKIKESSLVGKIILKTLGTHKKPVKKTEFPLLEFNLSRFKVMLICPENSFSLYFDKKESCYENSFLEACIPIFGNNIILKIRGHTSLREIENVDTYLEIKNLLNKLAKELRINPVFN